MADIKQLQPHEYSQARKDAMIEREKDMQAKIEQYNIMEGTKMADKKATPKKVESKPKSKGTGIVAKVKELLSKGIVDVNMIAEKSGASVGTVRTQKYLMNKKK